MATRPLKASVERFLRARGFGGIDDVEIAVDGRTIVLSGVIDDPESKRRCLECCRHVIGVAAVVDQLRLKRVEAENTHSKINARKSGV